MAPQNKRANVTKAVVPAKKAKVEQPDDPLALQIAPILAALSGSEETANCCDILRAALPHCLAEVPEQRHSFQAKMLDLTASALVSLDASARKGLAEAEATAAKSRTDATVARADFEAAQTLATAKKEQSDAKGLEVDALKTNVNAAKTEVKAAEQKKETFLTNKAALVVEQEAFQKVMDEMWTPLKTCTFTGQQWRKRDKFCTDLFEKLTPLNLEESLVEGLMVALKLKLEQRSAFAEKAMACAEEVFEKHKALLVERIGASAGEEAACDKDIAEAEAKLQVAQAEHSTQDKEYDELQNVWAELETKSKEAESKANNCDAEVQDADEDLQAHKTDLEETIAVCASFAALRIARPVLELPAVDVSAEGVTEPSTAMETEPEIVVAAA